MNLNGSYDIIFILLNLTDNFILKSDAYMMNIILLSVLLIIVT